MSIIRERTLSDLFVTGKVHTLSDGKTVTDPETGEEVELAPVTVYVKKLNNNETQEAIKLANSARARITAATRDETSEIYQEILDEAVDTPDENLIEYLIAEPLSQKRESIEAELADNPEWAEDDYLQGLGTAWAEGLREKYHSKEDDEEAIRVFNEMKRFYDEVDEILAAEEESLRRQWEHTPRETLERKAIERLLSNRGNLEWSDVFRDAQIYISTRLVDDPEERYWGDNAKKALAKIKNLETPVKLELLVVYRSLAVEPSEGKDSEETPAS